MDFLDFFNVWPRVQIDWVNNSKFQLLTFFCRFILHIFPNFGDDRMKTQGEVRKNAQNMLILTVRLTPVTLTLVNDKGHIMQMLQYPILIYFDIFVLIWLIEGGKRLVKLGIFAIYIKININYRIFGSHSVKNQYFWIPIEDIE